MPERVTPDGLPDGDGDCFLVALHLAYNMALVGTPDVRLAHGVVTGQGKKVAGVQFWHAWVEVGDIVFDYSNGLDASIRKELYYKIGKIVNVKTYPADEVIGVAAVHGHYGPWHTFEREDA